MTNLINSYSAQYDTDFYLCILDKKSGKSVSLSTNSSNLSIDEIVSFSAKSKQKEALNLNKIDALFTPLKLAG